MKSIVLGYSNDKATGPAKVLAGPEVSITDQVKLITGIKAKGNYPEGVTRIEYCELVTRNVGIYIKSAFPVVEQPQPTITTPKKIKVQ